MHRLINAVLVLTVLGSGFMLYSLEHMTRSTEREIAKLERAIMEEQEAINLLHAEWSSLTRPSRIEELAERHLGLAPIDPRQFVPRNDLASRLPEEPPVKLEAMDNDPIGAIIDKMQALQ